MEKFSIRDFRREDVKDVLRLHTESSENFEEREVTEDFIRSIARRDDFRFFVVTLRGRVVGFVGVLFHVNVSRAEIGPICVDSLYRGRGFGMKLLACAINFLRQVGIRRVIVRIKSDNRRAWGFFRKNGFVEEGYFRGYTLQGEDVIQLRKFL